MPALSGKEVAMAKDQKSRAQLPLDLDCTLYEVRGQTFSPAPNGGEGGLFSCSVGPLSEETIAVLDAAARTHGPVCLLFNEVSILLRMVTLERKDAQRVRIVGSVAKPSKTTAK
jgi:hypothetical protein